MSVQIKDFILALATYVVLHLVMLHALGFGHFIRNSAILMIGYLAFSGLSWAEIGIFVSFWNMYIFALICSRNSVSLRILDELMNAPDESLAKDVLLERFSDSESLSARIALMEKNGFVSSVGEDKVSLTSKATLIAKGILFGRRLFGVRNPG